MIEKAICRIGAFYDGSFFTRAQMHFYHSRNGWLSFQPFHELLEMVARDKEQGYASYKVAYAAWFQGLFKSTKATAEQLKNERNRYHDLMHAGIEARYLPMSESQREKGVDVAMAVDIMQVALNDKIDIAAIITGDADFLPLVRVLMKEGVRVMAVYFEYEDEHDKAFINERLLRACNYDVNVNAMEKDHKYKEHFKRLFSPREIKEREKKKDAVDKP